MLSNKRVHSFPFFGPCSRTETPLFLDNGNVRDSDEGMILGLDVLDVLPYS